MSIFLPFILLFFAFLISTILNKESQRLKNTVIKTLSIISAFLFLSGGVLFFVLFFQTLL